MKLAAAAGELKHAYHQAARLSSIDLEWSAEAQEYRLAATVVSSDAFRLSQQPLVLQIRHQHGVWRWPVKTLQIADGVLHGTLGPKERSDARRVSESHATR